MPSDMVVGEILETVPPDQEVLGACKRMKDQGYRLALDDYCDLPAMQPFLELADFVKVDLLLLTSRSEVLCSGATLRIPTVAEKVETHEQFRRCMELATIIFRDISSAGLGLVVGAVFPPIRPFISNCYKRRMSCFRPPQNLDDFSSATSRSATGCCDT